MEGQTAVVMAPMAKGDKHKEKFDDAMQRTDEAIRRAADKFRPKPDFDPSED